MLCIERSLFTIIIMSSEGPSKNNPMAKAARYVKGKLSSHLHLLCQPVPRLIPAATLNQLSSATSMGPETPPTVSICVALMTAITNCIMHI